ncbi:MAG: hypothetical protein OXG07_09310 [Anaerolineaceae bacterium]|nr:hypothetical protein [Anaerolineaceae bacterium]
MTPGTESLCGQGKGLRRRLQQERERMLAEIRAFPPAIPACDAQFNHLLLQRDALGRDLGRLDDILAARISEDEKTRRLAALRRASAFLQPDTQGA